jgi:hypothetical protein
MLGQLMVITGSFKFGHDFFSHLELHPDVSNKLIASTRQNPCGISKEPIELTKWVHVPEWAHQARCTTSKNPVHLGQKDLNWKFFFRWKLASVCKSKGAWSEQRDARGCISLAGNMHSQSLETKA